MRASSIAAFAALGITLCATTARADAIDGDWCRADGKRMAIRGPDIVTPGGQQTRGEYSRHAFSYVVPNGEPGARDKVAIVLLSEYLAHAQQGTDPAVKEWRRCPPGVS
jgi:hypothetical protein